jgi:hypothetical protein
MTAPADELRAAAEKLRKLAAATTADIAANPYWESADFPPHEYPSLYARGVDNGLGGPAGAFAAAMHPGVGKALADLLADQADGDDEGEINPWALAVARAINAA